MTSMQMFCLGVAPITAMIVLLFVQWRYFRRIASQQASATEGTNFATTNYEPSYRKELDELVERMNKRKRNV